ncbi:MAG TPA: hypothetical protein VI588_02105, partial [Candidatus Gracilibacteria bacterium]|nr:hypothetical protein [Candidatus Gracilibacteria bacterium]
AATEAEDTLSPEETVPLSPAADETPVLTAFEDADVVALDAQALLESQALAAAAALETATHLAASEEEAARLAKSGPEDILYIAALGAIFYLNRRKLMAALRG